MTTINPTRTGTPTISADGGADSDVNANAPTTADAGPPEGYRYSDGVLNDVADSYQVRDKDALLRAAASIDDGNKYLNRTELTKAAEGMQRSELDGFRWSDNVLADVAGAYGIDDIDTLLKTAVALDNGNRYLNREELTAAAGQLQGGGDALEGYRWSPTVLARIMTGAGIDDDMALLREAVKHDDGNRYLKTSELEAAAKVLTGAAEELGVISDLDKTIIPAHRGDLPDAAYPGVAALFHELELGSGGQAGDTYYVTARTPDRVDGIPAWLDDHGMPAGTIDTGTSTLPWVAEPEKVADISRVLEANPDQRFLMFGDSSHRDPEVYRKVMELHPDQIKAVFIHKVNNVNPDRVAGMFAFESYAEVAGELLRTGVLDERQARRVMVSAQLGGLDITDAQIETLIKDNRP